MRFLPRQPWWTRLLSQAFVVNVATLGPLGRLRAPGTWGSAAGIAWYIVVCLPVGWIGALVIAIAGLYVAFALCGEAEKRLGKIDPSEVILDEFTAIPLTLLGLQSLVLLPHGWVLVVLAFVLFRFFDIAKPLGIRALQRFPGGTGVVIDDVAAALATCAVLHALVWFSPLGEWLRGAVVVARPSG